MVCSYSLIWLIILYAYRLYCTAAEEAAHQCRWWTVWGKVWYISLILCYNIRFAHYCELVKILRSILWFIVLVTTYCCICIRNPLWVTSFHFYDVLSYSIPLAFLYIVNRMYVFTDRCVTSWCMWVHASWWNHCQWSTMLYSIHFWQFHAGYVYGLRVWKWSSTLWNGCNKQFLCWNYILLGMNAILDLFW